MWAEAAGIPGYLISTLGRVRSVDRTQVQIRRGKPVTLQLRGRELRPAKLKSRYLIVNMGIGHRAILIHSLLLSTFVGPRPSPAHEAAHGDGIRDRNHLSNLRWATKKDNADDRKRHGTHRVGEQVTGAKLTWEQVDQLRAAGPLTLAEREEFSGQFGVSETTIRNAAAGKSWAVRPLMTERT